jgi:hypothetical protein
MLASFWIVLSLFAAAVAVAAAGGSVAAEFPEAGYLTCYQVDCLIKIPSFHWMKEKTFLIARLR